MTLQTRPKRRKKVSIDTDDGRTLTIEVDSCWNNEQLYCLCKSCAQPFYDFKDKKIVRASEYQPYLGECNICGSHRGYDFVIFEKST